VFVLEHLAQAAAIILLLELFVVVVIFLAISGGLAFGLRWVNGKTDPAFTKFNGWVAIGRKYAHRATDYLALPIILAGRYGSLAKGTLQGVKHQVRRNRERRRGLEMANEAAKPTVPEQEPNVLV
jgi:hypothetical protein